MDKKPIFTDKAPKAIGPYSQGVKSNGFLFISGQIAINPKTNEFDSNLDVKTQTTLTMNNLKEILNSEDLTFDHVIKTTIFLSDMSDFQTVNEVYGSFFKNEQMYPARATVALALPKNAKVKIEMIVTLN
ncbi:MAG: Rid family detoxifying hydrolase [Candidatus Hodarchaeales archaeon]|jgi:2-iminobutanoate/2-iminopropanoate deaminase